MVKKKISGQTIAIIALAIILVLTIGFGGVFAYFSTTSNSVTGHITMASLNIDLKADHEQGSSDKSEIILSSTNVLPDQKLENSPLVVMNSSDADVYLIVVYRVEAVKKNDQGVEIEVEDNFDGCLIDLDIDYINNKHSKNKEHYGGQLKYTEDLTKGTKWVDYVFTYVNDKDTEDPTDDEEFNYRCLVCLEKQNAPAEGQVNKIPVIAKDTLGLHQDMDNNYQTSSLTFTFQAYVIGAGNQLVEEINAMTSVEAKCYKIVSETYKSQDFTFLNVSATR